MTYKEFMDRKNKYKEALSEIEAKEIFKIEQNETVSIDIIPKVIGMINNAIESNNKCVSLYFEKNGFSCNIYPYAEKGENDD